MVRKEVKIFCKNNPKDNICTVIERKQREIEKQELALKLVETYREQEINKVELKFDEEIERREDLIFDLNDDISKLEMRIVNKLQRQDDGQESTP